MSGAIRTTALALVWATAYTAAACATDHDIAELFDPASAVRAICGRDDSAAPSPDHVQLAAIPLEEAGARPPLYTGLGNLSFKISSPMPEAQAYFDQGLRLTYAFNHGEAIRSFRAAQGIDPACAICAWGEALALGPNINAAMTKDENKAALKALDRAKKLAPRASLKERALIDALAARYNKKGKREDLDAAYADAMHAVHAAYPNDADIATLFAEAAMDATRWHWWNDGEPIGRMGDAITALEGVLKVHPDHPGAIHYYIHVMEPSPTPEKAEAFADTLGGLMPAAGHMVHMPSHIYFRIGRYKDAINANVAAVAADEQLLAALPEATERYRYGYYPHNIHMALAAADMAGDSATALKMSEKLLAALSTAKKPDEFYVAASYAPHVRFESPAAILALPKPSKKMPYATGLWLHARASAFAWQKDIAAATNEADALAKLRLGKFKKKDFEFRRDVLEVAEDVARARIALAQGDIAAARKALEAGISVGDTAGLWRGDPPAWDFPLRQALGVLLLQTGHPDEAAPILRQALMDTPNNGLVLFALQRASVLNGDSLGAEQYGKLFAKAWLGTSPPDLGRI